MPDLLKVGATLDSLNSTSDYAKPEYELDFSSHIGYFYYSTFSESQSDGHEPIFWGSGRAEPDTIWLEPGRAGP